MPSNAVTDAIQELRIPETRPESVRTGPVIAAMTGPDPNATHPAATAIPAHEINSLIPHPYMLNLKPSVKYRPTGLSANS